MGLRARFTTAASLKKLCYEGKGRVFHACHLHLPFPPLLLRLLAETFASWLLPLTLRRKYRRARPPPQPRGRFSAPTVKVPARRGSGLPPGRHPFSPVTSRPSASPLSPLMRLLAFCLLDFLCWSLKCGLQHSKGQYCRMVRTKTESGPCGSASSLRRLVSMVPWAGYLTHLVLSFFNHEEDKDVSVSYASCED